MHKADAFCATYRGELDVATVCRKLQSGVDIIRGITHASVDHVTSEPFVVGALVPEQAEEQ